MMYDITFSNIFFFIQIYKKNLEYYIIGKQIFIIFHYDKFVNKLLKIENFCYYAFYDYDDLYLHDFYFNMIPEKIIIIILLK